MNNLTVFKYPVVRDANEYGDYSIRMPLSARVLSAVVDADNIVQVYAQVEVGDTTHGPRCVTLLGTGREMEHYDGHGNLRRFIGTVQQPPFVWHVFVEGGKP